MTRREALIRALTYADLRAGKGSQKQLTAYRELEWRRCARDFEYFRVNYCMLLFKGGRVEPWHTPYPIQVAAAAEWLNGDSTIEVKSRQLGQTTNAVHFALWEAMFKEAVIWNFFGADDDASKDMKRRLDATLDRMPTWMRERASVTERKEGFKRKNAQEAATIMTFGLSMIRVFTGSVRKAQGLTGKTLFDDAGKHTDPERKWQLLYPTIDDPDPANRGQVIIIFNGNGEDFLYHLYQKAKANKNSLNAHFYSWRDDPRRLWMSDEETGVGPHCVIETRKEHFPWYDHAEDQYLVENPDKDRSAFKAQYPNTEDEAFYISTDSRFDNTKLQGFSLVIKKLPGGEIGSLITRADDNGDDIVEWRKHGNTGNMRLFERPVEGAEYVVGVDPAGGHADSDYSVIQVCRVLQGLDIHEAIRRVGYDQPPTVDGMAAFEVTNSGVMLEQVLVYQARSEPTFLAQQTERIGEWYNDALVVVESIAHGGTVLEHLKHTYWNLYREERTEKVNDDETERLGWWPQAHAKTRAIDNLAAWLGSAWILLRDGATVNELRVYGYQQSAGGAISLGAPKGMHDDLVMGLALCVVGVRSLVLERSARPVKRFGLEW